MRGTTFFACQYCLCIGYSSKQQMQWLSMAMLLGWMCHLARNGHRCYDAFRVVSTDHSMLLCTWFGRPTSANQMFCCLCGRTLRTFLAENRRSRCVAQVQNSVEMQMWVQSAVLLGCWSCRRQSPITWPGPMGPAGPGLQCKSGQSTCCAQSHDVAGWLKQGLKLFRLRISLFLSQFWGSS